jgi:hypothetical protein
MPLDYSEGAGEIVVSIDSSLTGWGGTLGQEVKGKGKTKRRTVAKYVSGLWSHAEADYDATKRECRGVLKALRACRFDLYGVHFILETDAQVLIAQLNRSATDLPGALIVRWIAWIRLFDFDVRHIPGNRHTAADGLSRRPRVPSDDVDRAGEIDIDDFITDQLMGDIAHVGVAPLEIAQEEQPLEEGYSEKSQRIATYLTTLKLPRDLSRIEGRAFKKHALLFCVVDRHLFRRKGKTIPLKRVVDNKGE